MTGKWHSNDPIGISGGLNQYVFCGNNPVNFVDWNGLETIYTGKASWYNLPGNKTASGEMFDPNAMAAAMTKEKVGLGTGVRVEYDYYETENYFETENYYDTETCKDDKGNITTRQVLKKRQIVKTRQILKTRSIMVTVNDRGPFAINDKGKVIRPLKPHPIRIIDLTPTAFKTLTGDLDLGVINVRVVVP